MKKFTFFAKTNPLFMQGLKSEIKELAGIETTLNIIKKNGYNGLRFDIEMEKVWKILLYSRMLEGIKILVKENVVIKYYYKEKLILNLELKKI